MKIRPPFLYLPSYKLDFVAGYLGVGRRVRTGGFELWADVMAGDERRRRTCGATTSLTRSWLEAVFDKLRAKGWIRGCRTMRSTAATSARIAAARSYRRAAGSTRKPGATSGSSAKPALHGRNPWPANRAAREAEGGGVIPLRMDYMREKYRAKPAKASLTTLEATMFQKKTVDSVSFRLQQGAG